MIRGLQFGDLADLEKIPRECRLPDIGSGLYCSQKALLNGGVLVGAAFLKLTAEAVLILDPKLNDLTRASLVLEAMGELESEAVQRFGLDEVHVFLVSQHFTEILKKHFHFQDVKGTPLVWMKGDQNGR